MKKFTSISAVIILSLSLLLLVGCDFGASDGTNTHDFVESLKPKHEPTAEDLVNHLSKEDFSVMDADMFMEVEAEMDASEFGDGLEGAEMKMQMGVVANMNYKVSGKIQHMSGTMKVDVLGISTELPMEEYTIDKGDIIETYVYDVQAEEWHMECEPVDGDSETSLTTYINTKCISDLVLAETTDDSTDYVVTGKIDYNDAMDSMGGSVDSIATPEGTVEDLTMNVELVFDKETEQLKELNYTIDEVDLVSEDVEFSKFNIEITFNQIGGDIEIEVPDEVTNSGDVNVEEGSLDNAVEGLEHFYHEMQDTTSEPSEHSPKNDELEDLREDIDSIEEPVNVEDFAIFEFSGNAMYIGQELGEFLKGGWYIDTDWCDYEEDMTVAPEQYVSNVYLACDDYENWVSVSVININDTDCALTECAVASIKFDNTSTGDNVKGCADVVLNGGVTWGSSLYDVMKVYDKPDSIDTSASMKQYLDYVFGDLTYSLVISNKGGLEEISIYIN